MQIYDGKGEAIQINMFGEIYNQLTQNVTNGLLKYEAECAYECVCLCVHVYTCVHVGLGPIYFYPDKPAIYPVTKLTINNE